MFVSFARVALYRSRCSAVGRSVCRHVLSAGEPALVCLRCAQTSVLVALQFLTSSFALSRCYTSSSNVRVFADHFLFSLCVQASVVGEARSGLHRTETDSRLGPQRRTGGRYHRGTLPFVLRLRFVYQ